MIICKKCGEEKDIDSFYIRKETGRPRSECKECWNKTTKKWQKNNIEKVRSYVRKSCKKAYDENPEKYKEKSRIRRENNPEEVRNIVNKSYNKNYQNDYVRQRARLNRNAANRRAATPSWLSAIQKAMILEFYDIARARSVQTGVTYHVDHIMPVNGKNSCGLHVPWNMQVLSQSENCAKKNLITEG